MKVAHLIYPNQLFEDNDLIEKADEVYLIEDSLFFGDYKYPLRFHKFKLILHRASMKGLERKLQDKGFKIQVNYIEYGDKNSRTRKLFEYLKNKKVGKVLIYDPVDFFLEKRLKKAAKESEIELVIEESPNFINKNEENAKFFLSKKKFRMADFYIWQRKRLKILLDKNQNPIGGKWSFDTENRKKLPKDIQIPKVGEFKEDEFLKEAIEYVGAHFPNNPGPNFVIPSLIGNPAVEKVDNRFTLDSRFHGNGKRKTTFPYPTYHSQAKKLLQDFIKNKLANFGPYQDAISENEDFVFHSVLSSSINIGLLSPKEIINEVIKYYNSLVEEEQAKILPSVEGFIRQVLGWREFMRAVYVLKGVEIRNSNFFGCKAKLTEKWYSGSLGVLPVDNVIKKVNQIAYAHHIERLMVMGNFMLLCEIEPNEIYKWFMEMHIDAYDWVMVPNVYSMSQYADGGLITTKPYFSGSNYILKMSNYKKGDWSEIWDALFWNFVNKNREFLGKNPRIGLMVKNYDRKSEEEREKIRKTAEEFKSKI
jgi:deoxyribodipyrimidine photolyase-related protein